MKLLRNRKVKTVFFILLLLGLAEGIVLYRIVRSMWYSIDTVYDNSHGYIVGIIVTVCVASLIAVSVYLTAEYLQSKKISRFQQKIERNLHGRRELDFGSLREGEFESLEASIGKMVNALYAQQDALQDEQTILVDALTNISHQIKTPLAAIRMTTDMMAADPGMDPLERELRLERMQGNIDRISDFIRVLLNISRLDAGVEQMKEEEFTAQELIRMVVVRLRDLIEEKDIDLQLDAAPDIGLRGDKHWLAEALSNIVKNCIEHSEMGGSIFITASKNAVYALIEIRDTGRGIDKEDLPYIFDRYHKGKNASSNSVGIGLYFARQVIHRMGGTVKADNHPQGGAVFSVRLNEINV